MYFISSSHNHKKIIVGVAKSLKKKKKKNATQRLSKVLSTTRCATAFS